MMVPASNLACHGKQAKWGLRPLLHVGRPFASTLRSSSRIAADHCQRQQHDSWRPTPRGRGCMDKDREHRQWLACHSTTAGAAPVEQSQRLVLTVPGSPEIVLETGEIGRQANGSVMATMGETILYVTACCDNKPTGDGSFLPLQVNYQERFSAAGRTSGGFLKRERPKEDEVLVARLVDRPLRPMFEEGWSNETQVLEWVLSFDGVNQPEPLAITAAAAALLISDIPLTKAVAGVRVGWLPEGIVINPTAQQMAASKLDLMIAGTQDAVLMIEGFCDFLNEEEMLEAVGAGAAAISSMCQQLETWAASVGKPNRPDRQLLIAGLEERVAQLGRQVLWEAYSSMSTSITKDERSVLENGVKKSIQEQLAASQEFPDLEAVQLELAFKRLKSSVMRDIVLKEGRRADGRTPTQVRPIRSRAGLLPRTHGSALFTRGETQAMCVATLGSAQDAQRIDSIRTVDDSDDAETRDRDKDMALERFYLQYFFPPSSVGETGRVGAPGRRELGHGELAQRALVPVIPPQDAFPYTVRVESTITESNGSSSMASVCGGCLAMLDAGVPLKEPVAGIAMGLILEPDGSFQILSDILGSEDALGDMDFKVAGTASGITAFQMDIKVEGITLDIMRQALKQAAEGRAHILQEMARCDPPPRRSVSQYVPSILMFNINPAKNGIVIGTSGKTIRALCEASGATNISLNDTGLIEVTAPSVEAAEACRAMVRLLADDIAPGTVLRQRPVVKIAAFGAFVELCPGKEGLVHVSQVDIGHVTDVEQYFKAGDKMDVMVLGATPDGKVKLSRKAVQELDTGTPLEEILSALERPAPASPRQLEGQWSAGKAGAPSDGSKPFSSRGSDGTTGRNGRPPPRQPRTTFGPGKDGPSSEKPRVRAPAPSKLAPT